MRDYLIRWAYSKVTTERVLEKLRGLNYINDESFARNWAAARVSDRRHGPKRIRQELSKKGISDGLVREVLRETFDQVEERKQAQSLLEKRFKNQQLGDPKILRRAAGFLERRGYSSQVIFDLLRPTADD
ncbi:MAG TPA: regulatory protein RecX [Candidatus Binatia bacterium]|nr:regulatory protein RecX [Candidatus Binatia bacterium]